MAQLEKFKDTIYKIIHVGSVAHPSARPVGAPSIGRCFALAKKALAGHFLTIG